MLDSLCDRTQYSLTKDELEARIKLAAKAQMHYKTIVETARRLGREQVGDNGIR